MLISPKPWPALFNLYSSVYLPVGCMWKVVSCPSQCEFSQSACWSYWRWLDLSPTSYVKVNIPLLTRWTSSFNSCTLAWEVLDSLSFNLGQCTFHYFIAHIGVTSTVGRKMFKFLNLPLTRQCALCANADNWFNPIFLLGVTCECLFYWAILLSRCAVNCTYGTWQMCFSICNMSKWAGSYLFDTHLWCEENEVSTNLFVFAYHLYRLLSCSYFIIIWLFMYSRYATFSLVPIINNTSINILINLINR